MANERKRQMHAASFGMGDIKVGKITGQYPNVPVEIRQRPRRVTHSAEIGNNVVEGL